MSMAVIIAGQLMHEDSSDSASKMTRIILEYSCAHVDSTYERTVKCTPRTHSSSRAKKSCRWSCKPPLVLATSQWWPIVKELLVYWDHRRRRVFCAPMKSVRYRNPSNRGGVVEGQSLSWVHDMGANVHHQLPITHRLTYAVADRQYQTEFQYRRRRETECLEYRRQHCRSLRCQRRKRTRVWRATSPVEEQEWIAPIARTSDQVAGTKHRCVWTQIWQLVVSSFRA